RQSPAPVTANRSTGSKQEAAPSIAFSSGAASLLDAIATCKEIREPIEFVTPKATDLCLHSARRAFFSGHKPPNSKDRTSRIGLREPHEKLVGTNRAHAMRSQRVSWKVFEIVRNDEVAIRRLGASNNMGVIGIGQTYA